jgi:hypothetical protein
MKMRHRLTSSMACLWYALPMLLIHLARERASNRASELTGIPMVVEVGAWGFACWRRSKYVGLTFPFPALCKISDQAVGICSCKCRQPDTRRLHTGSIVSPDSPGTASAWIGSMKAVVVACEVVGCCVFSVCLPLTSGAS